MSGKVYVGEFAASYGEVLTDSERNRGCSVLCFLGEGDRHHHGKMMITLEEVVPTTDQVFVKMKFNDRRVDMRPEQPQVIGEFRYMLRSWNVGGRGFAELFIEPLRPTG